jgi:plasmid stabilization system protein ParE
MTTSRPNKIKAVKPAPNVTDEYIRAFAEIASRIQKAIKAGAPHSAEAVRMIVAGGAAQHFYTAARVSVDIDATLSKRMILPPDLDVPFLDADGSPRVLYFDRQYNDTFALMHEDADADSRPLALPGIDANVIDVRLLAPVDLAVYKISRFAEHDQADIAALARAGLIDAASVLARAEEAVGGYIGDMKRIANSIGLACKLIEKSRPPLK